MCVCVCARVCVYVVCVCVCVCVRACVYVVCVCVCACVPVVCVFPCMSSLESFIIKIYTCVCIANIHIRTYVHIRICVLECVFMYSVDSLYT